MTNLNNTNYISELDKVSLYFTIDPWIISDWAPNFGPAEWWNRKTKNELRLYYKEGHFD